MKIKKNLLIICEGENTEPNYFHDIRNKIIEQKIDYSIEIRPRPPQEIIDSEKQLAEFKLRKGAKKRTVTNTIVDDHELIEDQYKAQPTRYIREAQLGLIDGTYEEAWAVYDLDGHAEHVKAYELSKQTINGKKIQIGFSSISFEMWVLWHFEPNSTPFIKSQCRTGKKFLNCGQAIHSDDCNGNSCVTGYMKHKGYIQREQDIKVIRFSQLEAYIYTALTNSLEVRMAAFSAQSQLKIYEINPITTVDRLIFKLLNLPLDYQWARNEDLNIPGFETSLKFEKQNIHIQFENTNTITGILQPDFVVLVNVQGDAKPILEREILEPKQIFSFTIDLLTLKDFIPSYIAFKNSDNVFLITELPTEI